jgi:hypothetical protein
MKGIFVPKKLIVSVIETNFSKRDKDGFEDAILSPPPLLTLEYKPEKSPAYPPATAPDL